MRPGGERGQTAAEYLGVLLVVSVIVAAVASTDVGGQMSRAMATQVCTIANGGEDKSCDRAERRPAPARRRGAARTLFATDPVTAQTATIPCDNMTPRECTALRGAMNRARTELQNARDEYIRYAADFALWVATVERIRNVNAVVYRPGLFKAVNRYLRKQINREGARLLTAVRNKPLENLIVSNYRYGAKIGKGSTADAVRHEVATGVAWGAPRSHYIKAVESIRRLNTILRRETLTFRERQIAANIRRELWDALPPHRRPPLR
jgi:pilus assembly protein Flp/PilA